MSSIAGGGLGERHRLVEAALEAVRQEVAKRLTSRGLPTTTTVNELVINNNEDGTGWSSAWESRQVSTLHGAAGVLLAVGDDTVPYRPIGLRDQLEDLARFLCDTTDLAERPAFLLPSLTGVEAVLARFVTSLAYQYLYLLPDVGRADPQLVSRLSDDLDQLCNKQETVFQLAINGVHATGTIRRDGWTVRTLSPRERGAIVQSRGGLFEPQLLATEFVVPYSMDSMHSDVPTILLQHVLADYEFRLGNVPSTYNRLALAFFLLGYEISSLGGLAYFQRPIWASLGIRHSSFPVGSKTATPSRLISQGEFGAILAIMDKIPTFSGVEERGREIALYRTLRACGTANPDEAFLDFAIALEAALLGGVRDELSYRFRLYGALFLAPERPTKQTAASLQRIYDVRSKLVHGSTVKPEDRQVAAREAADLAKAVVRRSVTVGWPDRAKLDAMALTADLGASETDD